MDYDVVRAIFSINKIIYLELTMKKIFTHIALGSTLALSMFCASAADFTLKIQSSDPAGDQNFLTS